jgi:hypothetical protein
LEEEGRDMEMGGELVNKEKPTTNRPRTLDRATGYMIKQKDVEC